MPPDRPSSLCRPSSGQGALFSGGLMRYPTPKELELIAKEHAQNTFEKIQLIKSVDDEKVLKAVWSQIAKKL